MPTLEQQFADHEKKDEERIDGLKDEIALFREQFGDHMIVTHQFMKETKEWQNSMKPAQDALITWQNLTRFRQYTGISFIAVLVFAYWVIRKLFP